MIDDKTLTKGEKTRAAILEAAHALFLKNGFHGTSMRQIADEAGLALGGLYNYFDSKEKIFGEVLDAHHPYRVILPALEQTQGDTVEELVRDLAGKVREGMESAEDNLFPLIFIDFLEFRGRYLKRIVAKFIPSGLSFFQKFSSCQGNLRKIPQPVMLRALAGLMIGYFLTELIARGLPLVKQLMPKDSFEQVIEIYLHGIVQE
jgi:AcrR family transcriptional regulator